ncbi:hypothetical protein [Pelagicoccus mobilis]|uniref:Uncharacterized protein n=1 Tax=Pelagicoccus mobilis TaxID=415221 RepID=A0A934RVD7_9BACT|nr:hypothetical protein [Pelagicoccus mobilis]MBK1876120.1 hypothetical protein [Pelagicoccus mobilis]
MASKRFALSGLMYRDSKIRHMHRRSQQRSKLRGMDPVAIQGVPEVGWRFDAVVAATLQDRVDHGD